ncbi:hypothetical protein [Vibrio barjaei]|jgi:hypothetical protein|uniref:Uncharacterized protein n=1 Tax=Vibrio barjaei TaxID=1676683 RepID=A0ABW7IKX9_9VIBR|nr:hypothetical protein [Vibrio barjaei]MCG9786405.1 hypothetical protein [Vibrio mediterranei]MCY9869804.1 hypothetical protein [Vibrio barjaei]
MNKLLLAFSVVLLAVIATLSWVFIPTHETMGKQTLNVPLSDEFKLVAHRIHSTDPDAGPKYAYFVLSDATPINNSEPFLVTSDQFTKLEKIKDNGFTLTVNGRIYEYHNDLWIKKPNGQLHRWHVSINARYIR